MRMIAAAAAGAALLGACATPDPAAEAARDAEAAARLAEATQGLVPREPVSCVNLTQIQGNRSIGDDLILFDGRGGRLYANRTTGCQSLRFGRALLITTPTGQLCQGEVVQVIDPATGMNFGPCGLGPFIPYEPRR